MKINPETGLYGEYGFIYEPLWQKPSFIIPVIITLSFIFIVIAYFLYTYYQKRKMAKMNPSQRAFYMLDKLKKNKLSIQDIKKWTEHILIIIKTYGEKKYHTKIIHYTPQECAEFFSSKVDKQEEKNQIGQLFSDIESILFSSDYKNEEVFFAQAPHNVHWLIKLLEYPKEKTIK